MTSLLIDTCTEHGLVIFFSGDTVLYQGTIPKGLHNSKYMMTEIDKGLKELAISVKDLQFIAVTIGPGSYTGIRVGVIAAKTLAYAGNIPIVTLCSLDGYIPNKDGRFISIIDAKIGGGYFRAGVKTDTSIEWLNKPSVSELDKLEELKTTNILVSPNCGMLQKKIHKLYPETTYEWLEGPPNIERFMMIANQKFRSKNVELGTEFELLYLRRTQAEIERDK